MDHRLLPSLPDIVENSADPTCTTCGGVGWVCENHTDRVWDGMSTAPTACGCGAGAPCRCTGMDGRPD